MSYQIGDRPSVNENDLDNIAWSNGVVLEYHDAPGDESETIDAAIRTMTALTAKIVRILADNDVHPALCETVEYQIHQLWSNALRTVSDAQ